MQLRIKEFRERRGMTLAQLGKIVGREAHTIYYYENGTINLNLVMLERLALALGCTPQDLIPKTEAPALASPATPQDASV